MRGLLLTLTSIVGVTSLLCGALMIYRPDGHLFQLSVSLLKNSPFRNFLIPGIILFAVVGGTNAVATVALLTHRKHAANSALLAGICLCGWVLVQMWITAVFFWLQFVYLAAGLGILLLAFQTKKKWLV
ncbi:MAG TPA: hypothetical protein VL307_05640 [Chitinophagaceae bacterium]|nr:hypothetical protein [Chitinophagaceae bacterium]